MSLSPTTLNAEKETKLVHGYFYMHCTTEPRRWFFGKMVNRKMLISEEGELALGLLRQIPQQFPLFELDSCACQPDGICGILKFRQSDTTLDPHLINDVVRWFKNQSAFDLRAFNPTFSWSPTHTCLPLQSVKDIEQTRWEIQRYR